MDSYFEQLEQVSLALADPGCENRVELLKLQADLVEIISLTKNDDKGAPNEVASHEMSDDEDEEDDLSSASSSSDLFSVGSKCRAPFVLPFSANLPLHNAIIMEIDDASNKANVMFCNPMSKRMQPCVHFLNGKCTYGENCRFSHGEQVNVDDLCEFSEPNFENIVEGSLCLVKRADNLWKLGRVSALSVDEQSAAVKISETGEEIRIPFAEMLPIDEKKKSDSDESDEDEEHLINGTQESGSSSHHAWKSDNLGVWEKHTKGVASKLMARMGFRPGQGLGKDSDGRLEPVEAKIMPKGKSLDVCLKTDEEKLDRDPLKVIKMKKRKEKLKERRRIENSKRTTNKKPATNVFDIINESLSGAKSTTIEKPTTSKSASFSELSDKELHIEHFRAQKLIQDEEVRLKGSTRTDELTKHVGLGRKSEEIRNHLTSLRKRESEISKEIANRKNRRKYTQF